MLLLLHLCLFLFFFDFGGSCGGLLVILRLWWYVSWLVGLMLFWDKVWVRVQVVKNVLRVHVLNRVSTVLDNVHELFRVAQPYKFALLEHSLRQSHVF